MTPSTAALPPPTRTPIRARRLGLTIDPATPRHWSAGDPEVTRLLDTLSLTFPDGEQFFVDSVRRFREHALDEGRRSGVVDPLDRRDCTEGPPEPVGAFGRTAERRMERRLLADYETLLDQLGTGLDPDNHATAVELARIPQQIRGFGHVKEASLGRARAAWADLLAAFRGSEPVMQAAE